MLMKKDKILNILLLCLKIVLPVLLIVPLAFFTYRLIENHIYDLAHRGEQHYCGGIGLYVFASHIVLLVANVILTVIGVIGLVIAKKHKSSPAHKKNVITFSCLALSPFVSQLLYVLITLIVLNIG